MESEIDQFATTKFYFYSRHRQLDVPGPKAKTKSGNYYRCYKDNGESLLFHSYNFRTGIAGFAFYKDPEDEPDIEIKLRKSFALSGKVDIRDSRTSELKGTVTRGRKFYDADANRLGRFVDSRSWKESFGESAFDAIGQLIFGNVDAPGGGLSRFGLIMSEQPAGYLDRQQLPFFPDPPRRTQPHRVGSLMKKVLPENLGSALFDVTPPTGWTLAIKPELMPEDANLLLLSTLMVIEINSW